jgi:tRNA uridine 5-carbamoylmethylation protein Kti12
MTLQFTYAEPLLPENKMRMYPTKVINVIGGPGSAKSMCASALIVMLAQRGKTVEHIPDYAKSLVWQKDMETLRNQYHIAQQQFRMLELLDGQVHYLVTECSLPQILYYNEHYPENICDVSKTRAKILEWYGQHNNVNVFVDRLDDSKYIHTGRFQDEEQARNIDKAMRHTLNREHIPYTVLLPELSAVSAFAKSLD